MFLCCPPVAKTCLLILRWCFYLLWLSFLSLSSGGRGSICGLVHMEVSQHRYVGPLQRREHAGQWSAFLRHLPDLWRKTHGCGRHRAAVLQTTTERCVVEIIFHSLTLTFWHIPGRKKGDLHKRTNETIKKFHPSCTNTDKRNFNHFGKLFMWHRRSLLELAVTSQRQHSSEAAQNVSGWLLEANRRASSSGSLQRSSCWQLCGFGELCGKFYIVLTVLSMAFALISGLELDTLELPPQMSVADWPELRRIFTERFASKTQADWSGIFDGTDACVTPVLSFDEVSFHPHNQERGSFFTDSSGEESPRPAPLLSRTPAHPCVASNPSIGEHTMEVLKEYGFSSAEIDQMLSAGVVECSAGNAKL